MHADCNEICPPPCPNALKTAAIITIQKLLEYPINPNEKALTRSEGTTISNRSVLSINVPIVSLIKNKTMAFIEKNREILGMPLSSANGKRNDATIPFPAEKSPATSA